MGQLVGASAHGQALAVAWRCEVVAQFGQVGVGQGQLLRRPVVAQVHGVAGLGACAAEGRRLQHARNRHTAALARAPIEKFMGFSVSPRCTGFRTVRFDALCRPRYSGMAITPCWRSGQASATCAGVAGWRSATGRSRGWCTGSPWSKVL